jgi:hypothetical protein
MRSAGGGRRLAPRLLATVLALGVAGCSWPHAKDLDDLGRRAATASSGGALMTSYARALSTAESTFDTGALTRIEAGSTLRVDQSAFTTRRTLGLAPRPFAVAGSATVWSSTFDSYPLWFVARVRLPQQEQQLVAVFSRASTIEPWRVVAAPRLAVSTTIPQVALAADGSAIRLADDPRPSWSDGTAVRLPETPLAIADNYADVLTSKDSPHADEFVKDSFITQMRSIRQAQPGSKVDFTQRWTASPVRYVLKLADGGALMFVTLHREDAFDVAKGSALSFEGSEAAGYISGPVRRHARLEYTHEVLMIVPAKGKPLGLGQYGGLVAAHGH